MKLTIIGCDGAYPNKNSATSGYLIEDKNTKVLLDCGSGVLSQLQNYIPLGELTGVVFSHFHRDHCADLECLQYAALIESLNKDRFTPLYMWGAGSKKEIERLTYNKYCLGNSFNNKDSFTVGDFTFSTSLNKHNVESYAIKVTDSQGKILVYSGDTSYYSSLVSFTRNSDCFLCECSLFNREYGKISGHLTAGEVGKISKEANVKSVILTHLPHYGALENLITEASEKYNGKIYLAKKGFTLTL